MACLHHLQVHAWLKPGGQRDAGGQRLLGLEEALQGYVASLREAAHCDALPRNALCHLLLYLLLCTRVAGASKNC